MRLLLDAEECVRDILENETGLKAVIIDPDGKKYEKSALEPEEYLKATVFQESLIYDLGTGMDVLSEKPVAIFAVRSLPRVPQAGEKNWVFRLQVSPFSEELLSFTMSGSPKPYKTLGFISIVLQQLSQS